MTGGIIQLVAYGREDLFLTRDPQITFFKIIYRRHTNFSKEEVCQSFIHEPDFGNNTTCIVPMNGDLIDNMTLKITLPEIPKFIRSKNGPEIKFAWIRRIGFAMIKTIEIEINGRVIDRHYGEWLHIWSILTTRNIKDNGLDRMIGNVPELTDFTNGKDPYTLFVPLQFWFCRASGLSIPLINLQYSDIKINIELFELDRCFRISPTHYIKCNANLVNFIHNEYLVQKGSDGIDRFAQFSHFDIITKRLYYSLITPDKLTGVPFDGNCDISLLDSATINALLNTPRAKKYSIHGISSNFSVVPDLGVKSVSFHKRPLKNISLKECVLLIDYIYLDTDERYKFAQTKHDYLIEQLYFTPNTSISSTNRKIKLDIDQPCKLIIWLAQFDYIDKYNDRFNYTSSHILKQSFDVDHTDHVRIKLFDNTHIDDEIGLSLINTVALRLNSQIRLTDRNSDYHEFIQPFQHCDNRLPKGSFMYSFALFPKDVAPSGTTNMSQIELIELNLKFNFKITADQPAKFRAYSLCYNVWRVNNGLSGTVFIR